MANWYLRYIHEKEYKNPIVQDLADFSQISYATWYRRLKKKSFQQLITRKQDILIENITHRQKPASKKSSHIWQDIPKSHKDIRFHELHAKEQTSLNNPTEEIENRMDEDKIDEMPKDECIDAIMKHPNSQNDKFTAAEFEEERLTFQETKLTDLRQYLKALEKAQT